MAPGKQQCKLQCTFPHTCQLSAFTLQDEEGRRGWKSIGSAAASVRPSLLEAVYGADMVIPGALLLGSLNSCIVTAMLWSSVTLLIMHYRPQPQRDTGMICLCAGSQGVARAAVWVSPVRREAMAQIKLF